MKKTFALFLMASAIAVTAGCTQQESAGPVAAEPQAKPSKNVEVSEEHAYCQTFTRVMDDYTDVVFELTTADAPNLDVNYWGKVDGMLNELDPSGLGKEWVQDHIDYVSMQSQINQLVEDGGGNTTFDTTGFKEGTAELLAQCVGAGYKASD